MDSLTPQFGRFFFKEKKRRTVAGVCTPNEIDLVPLSVHHPPWNEEDISQSIGKNSIRRLILLRLCIMTI